MQVTEEDGGRLNAFAIEPRMEVMEAGSARSGSSKMLLIGGSLLVLALLAVAVGIS
ncbi:MAG: ssl1498 family light-harvesting-like protein [Cyanobacteriota bacterium]|nr:ssl1498 family light-harvesting-like protein [Cyanobacteriota bacterium]